LTATEKRVKIFHNAFTTIPQGIAMTANDILAELEPLGSESYKKVMLQHGVKEPIFGVKISELKKIQKRIKKDYQLALDLYDTGVYDAMYLAGLIADDAKMTKKDLQSWVENALSHPLAEYTVAWVAAESPHGWDIALKWIESKKESIAAAGWATLCSLVAIKDDSELDLDKIADLLDRAARTIHKQPNRVRYWMNNFVISVGGYIESFTDLAKATAKKIGKVEVDMNGTACQVPDAIAYIKKVEARGNIGKKRKTAKC
jgi:3-methyladenine DNA glycosylase AlkD